MVTFWWEQTHANPSHPFLGWGLTSTDQGTGNAVRHGAAATIIPEAVAG